MLTLEYRNTYIVLIKINFKYLNIITTAIRTQSWIFLDNVRLKNRAES